MELFVWLGPIAFGYCIYKGIQHTKIKRKEGLPPWLITSIMNTNGPERKWNLK